MKILDSLSAARRWSPHCVATIGKYDGMHLGHQRILDAVLAEAARRALPSLVILSEPQPEEFFAGTEAPPRLNHFQDKVDFLDAYGIDAVYRMRFDEALSQQPAEAFVRDFLVAGLGLSGLVIGDDFHFGRNRGGDITLLRGLGGELGFDVSSVAPCIDGGERVSSTLVRQCLMSGDCTRAARLLGRPYSISGTVIEGRKLGRMIGVPTANLELLTPRLPMTGVFAVKVSLPGNELEGVANLGFKPTVDATMKPSLEVHVLDFKGDLYGDRIRVHFLRKLRDEQKFAGLPQLQEQIRHDIEQARECFAQAAGVAS
ncbi:MAG: bifunctional riboflavin kinase/FAD synthetase [Gammaproteobacteria bacterium]